MRILRPLSSALVCLALAGCSGDSAADDAGRFRPGSTGKPRTATQASRGVQLPRTLPPASMFVGAASHRTSPSRYCLRGECAALSPPAPSVLEAPSGVAVLFSLSAAPRAARLEVSPPGQSQPAVVALSPGPSIAWQATVPPGSYGLTLVATYPETEVFWTFALRVVTPKPAR